MYMSRFSLLPMQALSQAYYGMEFVVSLDAFDCSIDTPIWCEGFGVLMVIRCTVETFFMEETKVVANCLLYNRGLFPLY